MILIVGNWLLWAAVLVMIGSGVAFGPWFTGGVGARLRGALWLGLGLLVVTLLATHLFVPMGHSLPALVVGVLAGSSPLIALGSRLWPGSRRRPLRLWSGTRWRADPWIGLPALAAIVLLLSLALTSLGPITNYDTGLYHWPAINYAEAYRAIPGLGNFDLRLGYGTAVVPLAAFLPSLGDALPILGSFTPVSDGQTLRLLNGFLLTLLMVDVAGRVATQRSRPSAGTLAALLGLAVVWVGVGHSWDFITSPSPDTAPFVLVVALVSYLLDAVLGVRERALALSVALTVGTLAFTMRVQMLPVLIGVVAVLAVLLWPRRVAPGGSASVRSGLVVGGAFVTGLSLLMWWRDERLTGWFLYPLTWFPAGVEWRVPQGSVLAYAEVLTHFNQSRTGVALPLMQWLPGWVGRHAEDPGFLALGALIGLATLAWVAGPRRSPDQPHRRADTALVTVLLVAPFLLTAIAALVLAPDPRFIWGCLCAAGLIPAAIALMKLPGSGRRLLRTGVPLTVGLAAAVVLIAPTLLTDLARWGQLRVTFATYPLTIALGPLEARALVPDQTPVFRPEVSQNVTSSGLVVLQLANGDQCWRAFPLCTQGTAARPRGEDIAEGFLP